MVAGIWPVVDSKNTSNGVFIQVQSKRQVDLLSDARATEPRVASLHFYNGIDDLLARALRTWLASAAGGNTSFDTSASSVHCGIGTGWMA
jgi:hypothetical protein